ncbi:MULTISPECIES: hypothetical protein [Sphingomonadales]|uniref:Uncharacterized protein n=9 Tax=Sphingomonadales TaxID=204457 RepID=A0A7W6BJE3_9SPHN|nr:MULTISPECIES: hypothetical protein [Sphingomonadales]ARR57592.1 hypothetical protein HY78_29205 [Rhizorhabdus wittichii DC-6]EZP71268.1 hypothetical protein BV96_02541 [Sphingomonas paucimobilis]ALR21380.1 hypothetical protein ATN00_14850 [Sphingobium baderi]AMG73037.1 Uncharacterized protein SGRAN_0641 [Sphingopyxis granuli]AMK18066.1 hypothetical protein K663_08425 [Sphingobium sp. MI1205]
MDDPYRTGGWIIFDRELRNFCSLFTPKFRKKTDSEIDPRGHAKAKAVNIAVMHVETILEAAVEPDDLELALPLMSRLQEAMIT